MPASAFDYVPEEEPKLPSVLPVSPAPAPQRQPLAPAQLPLPSPPQVPAVPPAHAVGAVNPDTDAKKAVTEFDTDDAG
jgi:hypothetical protein